MLHQLQSFAENSRSATSQALQVALRKVATTEVNRRGIAVGLESLGCSLVLLITLRLQLEQTRILSILRKQTFMITLLQYLTIARAS